MVQPGQWVSVVTGGGLDAHHRSGLAIVIVAPGLTEPADARAAARKTEPAAAKLGRDSFLSGQDQKCYWCGQCDIIDDENIRFHD